MLDNKFLVAIDLDGTLLRDDKTISTESIKFLKEFEKQGNYVVIASGRAPRSILKYQKLLDLNSPFIAYNGAYGRSLHTDFKLDYQISFKDVISFYQDNINKTIDLMMCESKDKIFLDRVDSKLITFFEPMDMEIVKGDISQILKENVYSCIVKIKAPLNQNQEKIKQYFSKFNNLEIRFWSNCDYAEMFIKTVSKGHTLEKIVEICKVLKENVLVFGDAENDLEMLSMFKNSFLMKNGLDELKAKVNYVTKKDNNHDGVIFEIKNFIKNKL